MKTFLPLLALVSVAACATPKEEFPLNCTQLAEIQVAIEAAHRVLDQDAIPYDKFDLPDVEVPDFMCSPRPVARPATIIVESETNEHQPDGTDPKTPEVVTTPDEVDPTTPDDTTVPETGGPTVPGDGTPTGPGTTPESTTPRGPQGNNGHGNGDQAAPGGSGGNNNAENSDNSGQGNSGQGGGGKQGAANNN